MTKGILVAIFGAFAPTSVLMFGGANSIIPEPHRQVVDVHAWMSSEEFATLFAIAQAAPGPNILIVSLIGWQVAGFGGTSRRDGGHQRTSLPPHLFHRRNRRQGHDLRLGPRP